MKKKYAEHAFFECLKEFYNGVENISKLTGRDYFLISNWFSRGFIPKEEMMHISKALNIDVRILNNKHFHYIFDWKEEVKNVKQVQKCLREINSHPLKWKIK